MLVGAHQGGALPVLHLEHQQALARAQDHEVRLQPRIADRQVVPHDVVIGQVSLERLEQLALTDVAPGVHGGLALRKKCHRSFACSCR